jgi:hypothetical protein
MHCQRGRGRAGRSCPNTAPGNYITKLPNSEHGASKWQAATERGGPTMFARTGIMRALNRHVERVLNSSPKKMHWEKRDVGMHSIDAMIPSPRYCSR